MSGILIVCIIIYVISRSTSQNLWYSNWSSRFLHCTERDRSSSLDLSQYEVFGLDFLLLWNFLFLFLTTYSFCRRLSTRGIRKALSEVPQIVCPPAAELGTGADVHL